jgi:four helix bundle protein
MARSFRDLKVWQKSVELTLLVYEFTRAFPKEEVFGLTAQMRRASISIASNIAEGSARGTKRDFRQFVKLARGGNCELQTQLVIARELQLGDETKCDEIECRTHEIGRMLSALGKYLTAQIKAQPTASITEN